MRDVRLMTDSHRFILLPEETIWLAVRELEKRSLQTAPNATGSGQNKQSRESPNPDSSNLFGLER